jgi:hypothetical protein
MDRIPPATSPRPADTLPGATELFEHVIWCDHIEGTAKLMIGPSGRGRWIATLTVDVPAPEEILLRVRTTSGCYSYRRVERD